MFNKSKRGIVPIGCPPVRKCSGPLRHSCVAVNDTNYPFLTAQKQPEAGFLERIGLVRWGTSIPYGKMLGLGWIPDGAWWKIGFILLTAWGLRTLQSNGNIPDPFPDTGYNQLSMFVWGAFFFTSYQSLGSRAKGMEEAIRGAFNAITSYGQDLRGYLTLERMRIVLGGTYELRNYPSSCDMPVTTRVVTGRELICEIAELGKNVIYALGFSLTDEGIDRDSLPFGIEQLRMGLKYQAEGTDDDLSILMRGMQEHISTLTEQGSLPPDINGQLTSDNIGGANNAFGAVYGAKFIRPTRISNKFLMVWLYFYIAALVLIFNFSFFLDMLWVLIIAFIGFGSLEIRQAEADVFNKDNRIADYQFREVDDEVAKAFVYAVLSAFDGVNGDTIGIAKTVTPGASKSSLAMTTPEPVLKKSTGWGDADFA